MNGINYIKQSSEIGDSGEYDSALAIYLDDRKIGYVYEGEEIVIDGDFRSYIETDEFDEDEAGCPQYKCQTFSLDLKQLVDLQRLLMWWTYEYEEPKDLERKEKEGEQK